MGIFGIRKILGTINVNIVGTGAAAGSNTELQYNNASVFGGTSGLTYNDLTNVLTATNTIIGAISGNAGSVTNATLTTALTVNTGTLTLTGNSDNTSVLTVGAGAVSVSGANTGDQTNISGNAATVTTNANLTGVVTSVGNATAIADAALSIAKTSGLQTALDLKAPLATPVFTTNITTPLIIGGTAVGSKITYKSTTGAGTAAGIAHQFIGGTDGATVAATILNNGNVGIGTTGPGALLDIYNNTASPILRLNTSTSTYDPEFALAYSGTTYGQLYRDSGTGEIHLKALQSGSKMHFTTTGAGSFIFNNGNVGIGTTGPSQKLHVNGSIRMGALVTGAGGAVAVYRNTNGDLANSTSSIRYKTDVTSLENVLPKLLNLETVRFKWGQNTSTPGMDDYGMIAEQVALVLPDLVTYEDDGTTPRGLKYEKMGLFALKGLQEQQVQISSISSQLNAFSNSIQTNATGQIQLLGHCVTGDTLLPIKRRKKKRSRNNFGMTGGGDDPGGDRDGAVPLALGTYSTSDNVGTGVGEFSTGSNNNIGEWEWIEEEVRIDEVQEGDLVLGLNQASGELEYNNIISLMDMNIQDVYELTTASGRVIRTTSEHPFLVEEGV